MKSHPNLYKILENDNEFEIKVEKIGFHTITFGLSRTKEGSTKTNLFKLFPKISDIIMNLLSIDPRIQIIYLLFLDNGIVDTPRWKTCCQYYIKKKFPQELSVENNQMFLIIKRI